MPASAGGPLGLIPLVTGQPRLGWVTQTPVAAAEAAAVQYHGRRPTGFGWANGNLGRGWSCGQECPRSRAGRPGSSGVDVHLLPLPLLPRPRARLHRDDDIAEAGGGGEGFGVAGGDVGVVDGGVPGELDRHGRRGEAAVGVGLQV